MLLFSQVQRAPLGTSKFIFLVYVLLVNLLSVGAEVPANVNAAAPVLVLACICVCVVVAILLCQWSEGWLLCPLYVSSTSAAWIVEVLIDCLPRLKVDGMGCVAIQFLVCISWQIKYHCLVSASYLTAK